MSLFLLAVIYSLLFQFVYSQGCTAETGVKFTFYGYPDGNSDTTSFGCSGTSPTGQGNNGGTAGGSGTYEDPETFATALTNTNFKECEIIYLPYLQKYFRYNDHCQQCITDLANGLTHIDLWIGSDTNGGAAQTTCEDDFGAVEDQTIIRNPPTNLPVNSGALWDGSTCHNSPSDGMVFPNPNTSGLCSGGSSSPGGGSPAPAPSPSSTTSTIVPTTTPVTPSPSVINPSAGYQKAEVTPAASPSPSPSPAPSPAPVVPVQEKAALNPAVSSPPTPTTLVTAVLKPTPSPAPPVNGGSSKGKTWTPGMTYTQQMAASYAGCASWNGCIGDPCQSYDNCAGEWICIAGKCASSLHN
ncbi:hypothetical protein ABVK25_011917 [Lepraria finkii]|uniref:Uncharacterized protein n=1 Tax=Lepraria finkii TaxID=1340010 RepID=A0ABR4AKE9_9LECA